MLPFDSIGPYEVIGELGRGGMGVVYRAHDPQLQREVAIKLPIPQGEALDERALKRFDREARVLARLRHPHVVSVLSAGQHEGRPYLVLDLIEGRDLGHRLETEGPLDPKEAARLLAPIARALDHAHGRGVIHRDLKPENILVDADGHPYLTDFGLTRILDDEGSALTARGSAVGTLHFCSPEQLHDSRTCGPATDIYGLGATLYALLVGEAPGVAVRIKDVVHRILNQTWDPPSRRRSAVDPAFDVICSSAMALAPADRYPSGEALALDLERILAGEAPRGTKPAPLPRTVLTAIMSEEELESDDEPYDPEAPTSYARAPGELRTPDPNVVVPAPALPDMSGVARHHLERGRERLEKGELKEALSELHRAVALSPQDTDVRLARGLAFRRLGDPRAAIEDYDAVLGLDPDQVQALVARGVARMDLKDFVGASDDLKRALKQISPRSKRWEQVEKQLQRAQERLGSSELRGFRLPPGLKDEQPEG